MLYFVELFSVANIFESILSYIRTSFRIDIKYRITISAV